jgi:tetratricopeptide (TPR) repeat protein
VSVTDRSAAFRRYYPIAFVIALAVGVNGNTLFNDFVFDDIPNVLENRWITDVKFLPDIFSTHIAGFSGEYATSYYRPLIHVLYMAGYHVFGYAPWGFHLINILFHTAVSLLVYFVSSRLFEAPEVPRSRLSPPLLVASLFAVHPVHTEAVAWVAGIMDISFSLFYLLSFYMYIRSGEGDRSLFNRYYLASLGAFCLAALCKEPALTLPLLLAAYDHGYRGKGIRIADHVKRYIPYLALSAAYFLARVLVLQGFTPSRTRMDASGYQYVLNAFPLFAEYLGKLFLPVNLSPVHTYHPVRSILEAKSVFCIFLTVAFFTICHIARKKKPLFLGLAILAIPLLPAFYISAISGEEVFAERYLYLPTFGYAIVLAYLYSLAWTRLPGKFIAPILMAVALIGIFSIGTSIRNTAWKDSYALWSDTVKKAPQSAAARQYFGYALYSRGNIDEAIAEYRKALELSPRLFDARFNLGIAYHSKGLIDLAIEQYLITLRYYPGSSSTHNALGMAYGRMGFLDKAIEHFQAASDLDPGNEEARRNLLAARALKNRSDGNPPPDRP